jgi:hypothetical protein
MVKTGNSCLRRIIQGNDKALHDSAGINMCGLCIAAIYS